MENLIVSAGIVKQSFIEDCNRIGQLIYWHKHGADCIQVRQFKQFRWLLINDILQSVVEKNHPNQLLFPHLQSLACLWLPLTKPKKVLELGLGGGAIHNYIQHTYPDCQLMSVEKNASIIHCYKRFFYSAHASNLQCSDAQLVLDKNEQYDWVILDLFSQLDAPVFLYKHLFYEKIRNVLSTDGHLFINFLSAHQSQLKQLEQLLIATFGKPPSIEKIPNYTNHIVMISK